MLDVNDFCFYPADSAYSKNWIIPQKCTKNLDKVFKSNYINVLEISSLGHNS